jgi:antitoxin component HigA of HigAB toxin-antitoxin module
MSTRTTSTPRLPRYFKLVRRFPLVSIRNDKDRDRALEVIEELLDSQRSTDEDAYLNALSDLVWAYEERTNPVEQAEDWAMLEFLLDSKGITQTELARGTGIAASTISATLHKKRKLTREQISAVAKWFKVSPALFKSGV